ncbi:MAG: Gfo/Idh/MocA family oxidoreductase [bacterium]
MTPDRYNVVLVGLGRIALGYDLEGPADVVFTHAGACKAHREVNLVAGVDISADARTRFSAHTGVPAFVSVPEALSHVGRPDIAIVATPAPVRLDVIRQLVEAQPGVLLVEKPLAQTLEEGRDIVDLCRRQNVPLAVNYVRRFDPVLSHGPVPNGDRSLGNLAGFHIQFTGGLLENGSHYLDLLFAWFGKPADPARLSKTVCEVAVAGVRGTVVEHTLEYGLGEMDVFLQRGRFRLLDYGECYEISGVGPDPFFPAYRRLTRPPCPLPETGLARYQYHVLDRLVGHLRSGAPLPSTGDTALDVLECCEKLGKA